MKANDIAKLVIVKTLLGILSKQNCSLLNFYEDEHRDDSPKRPATDYTCKNLVNISKPVSYNKFLILKKFKPSRATTLPKISVKSHAFFSLLG